MVDINSTMFAHKVSVAWQKLRDAEVGTHAWGSS
jgi:hypothetical protein